MSKEYVITNKNFQEIRSPEAVYQNMITEVGKILFNPKSAKLMSEDELTNMEDYYAFFNQEAAKAAFVEGYVSAINELIRVLANVSITEPWDEGSESYKRLEETIKYFYSKETKLH